VNSNAVRQKKEKVKDKEAQAEEKKEEDEAQEQVSSCSIRNLLTFYFLFVFWILEHWNTL